MKVELTNYDGIWHSSPADWAATCLIFAKSTRLQMSPGLLQQINLWPMAKKLEELKYIANTIPSSHEFVDYTFCITDVTRGFSHQFVRGRHASYAQQTMRILDMSQGAGWDYGIGPSVLKNEDALSIYRTGMEDIATRYKLMLEQGVEIEDARGILPTNILTNIVVKMNLRTFNEMVKKRSSPRVQGEYRQVLDLMKKEVLRVHPWTELFFNRTQDQAALDLDAEIQLLDLPKEKKMSLHKLVDQLRQA